MELRQLKYFIGVADCGCFSKASRQLFISQSAVSQQIKLLEDELGSQLFVRQPNTVTLTESGAELYPLAKMVINNVSECSLRIKELQGLLCGELNIGLTYSLESYMREAMLEFMRLHPRVQVNAYYKNLGDLFRMLERDEVDMMLSMMPTSPHDFVESLPLMEYRLAAVMRKTHVLASKTVINFQALRPHPLILPEKGLRDRNAIESFIHKDTGGLKVRSLVNDVNALLNIVQETDYVSILTEASIVQRPLLCAVPIAELMEPIAIYAHFNRHACRKNSAMKYLDLLRQSAMLHKLVQG